jgi:prolipoprotein diacylglyceryl transferase
VLPLSLPSPPHDWSSFSIPLGFIHDALVGIIPTFPEQFTIHVYALAILAGILVAIIVANHRLTARGAEPWIVIDIAIWAVVFGIVGSRIWHVLTHPDDFFGAGKNTWNVFAPGSVWAVWEGGVAIFGAILGGALGAWIASRQTGLRFTAVADAIAPTLLLAQAFGRLGNYFNQELFGLPTDLPWGLEIDRPNAAIPVGIPEDALFHPTFLYEIIWNVAGFAILMLIENRVSITSRTGKILPKVEFARRDAWHWGKMMGLWAIWYGIGRVWFESIRLDPSETFLGIRSNVWGALAAIVLGLIILIVQSKRHPGIEPSPYRPGKEWAPDSAVDSDEIYSDTETDGDEAETTPAPATSGATRP